MEKIMPNTTQVPNFVLDELLPTLSDVELRIVLIVTRQGAQKNFQKVALQSAAV